MTHSASPEFCHRACPVLQWGHLRGLWSGRCWLRLPAWNLAFSSTVCNVNLCVVFLSFLYSVSSPVMNFVFRTWSLSRLESYSWDRKGWTRRRHLSPTSQTCAQLPRSAPVTHLIVFTWTPARSLMLPPNRERGA